MKEVSTNRKDPHPCERAIGLRGGVSKFLEFLQFVYERWWGGWGECGDGGEDESGLDGRWWAADERWRPAVMG